MYVWIAFASLIILSPVLNFIICILLFVYFHFREFQVIFGNTSFVVTKQKWAPGSLLGSSKSESQKQNVVTKQKRSSSGIKGKEGLSCLVSVRDWLLLIIYFLYMWLFLVFLYAWVGFLTLKACLIIVWEINIECVLLDKILILSDVSTFQKTKEH